MRMLGQVVQTLRTWLGLADASEAHFTPSHGWLLPAPVELRIQQRESATERAARVDAAKAGA